MERCRFRSSCGAVLGVEFYSRSDLVTAAGEYLLSSDNETSWSYDS